jgi:hypothetical protein
MSQPKRFKQFISLHSASSVKSPYIIPGTFGYGMPMRLAAACCVSPGVCIASLPDP